MDAIEMLKERRSVRHYKDEKVSHELMKEITEVARFAPSWANLQVARYTVIDDAQKIAKIADVGVKGFAYNVKTLKNAKGVMVLSFVKGKSGKFDPDADYVTSKGNVWEVFDAGIACQTFCLAAHAKGVGTCIFGVIDDEVIAEIADLPKDETVAAIITFGMMTQQETKATPRLDVEQILRFAD